MSVKLSIIIVTWNTADITKKAVDSIKKFLPKYFYQLIIVDNGSIDNTFDIFSRDKSIIYIRNNDNLGFSVANNMGAQKATAKYLLFLNSDMILIDNTVTKMFEHIQNDPRIGIIAPQLLNLDQSLQSSVFPPQTLSNAFREFWLKEKYSFSKYNPSSSGPSPVWAVSGGALMIAKQLFNQLGCWNEMYFFYFEDLDLCRRLHQTGYNVVFYPGCKVIHYHGQSGKNLLSSEHQWHRLVPSSIIFHGRLKHYLLTAILWLGQKLP